MNNDVVQTEEIDIDGSPAISVSISLPDVGASVGMTTDVYMETVKSAIEGHQWGQVLPFACNPSKVLSV